MNESALLRYGFAVVTTLAALIMVWRLTPLQETPFSLFFGAVVLTALYGGLGPAFLTTQASALLISYCFMAPYDRFAFSGEDGFRVAMFMMVSLMAASFVAGCRKTEKDLRESEERFRLLAETASDAILILDEEGKIVFLNALAKRIFGYDEDEMLGKPACNFINEEQCRHQMSAMRCNLDTRKPVLVEVQGRHQTGRPIRLEVSFGTFGKQGHNLFTAIIRELTQRRHALVEQPVALLSA